MRRPLAILAVLLVCAVGIVALLRADGGDDDRYRVRAIFDNAGFVIPGEDVKVAGVRVGTVDAVEVTEDHRAAVVLDIEDAGFQDFRRDASCRIRPQSLIGERFVECELTRGRAVGAPAPPPLEPIDSGPAEDQRLLGVGRTGTAVDLDLINDIYRLPYRQRLSIVINELGGALAGRGGDLDAVIRRANPALRELQDVLAILASENAVLARLARDADRALAPLARERRSVGRFVASAADVGQATVERRAELEATVERLPPFLRELRPTMRRLGALAGEMTPVLGDVGAVAPELNAFVRDLGPFAQAALPAFDTLGDAGRVGVEVLEASRPVIRQTGEVAQGLRPLGRTLADVLTSFERDDGIERLMDLLFYTVAASNGFDEFGHYLRASLLVNTCSTYAVEPVGGCSANFAQADATGVAASAAPRDPILRRTAAVLRGADPATLLSPAEAAESQRLRERMARLGRGEGAAPAVAAAEPVRAGTPAEDVGGSDEALLDFLFGKDAP